MRCARARASLCVCVCEQTNKKVTDKIENLLFFRSWLIRFILKIRTKKLYKFLNYSGKFIFFLIIRQSVYREYSDTIRIVKLINKKISEYKIFIKNNRHYLQECAFAYAHMDVCVCVFILINKLKNINI